MKIILEKNLDFRQFQNLIILIFCCVMVLLGMLNSLELRDYIFMKSFLFLFTIVLFAILFSKKGMYVRDNNLYIAVFLFGFLLKKKLIITSQYQKVSVIKGKLSTNYNYSSKIEIFHNWEPDLNYSVDYFSIIMINEDLNSGKKIISITKSKKVKIAIDFILKNTNLKYS
ncbi:hypothetical protein EV144_103628 [Flavobacterium sp. 270]|nr:hypothetical protein EV144_103628 [Flavobacterium sp. 270]